MAANKAQPRSETSPASPVPIDFPRPPVQHGHPDPMPLHITHFDDQKPFITKDGSTIRSILDKANAPVQNQSLAEATVPAGGATERHYHKLSEEFYFILEGSGMVEIDGESKHVRIGDAILIPAKAWHQIMAADANLRFLCCCSPPYSHEDTYFN